MQERRATTSPAVVAAVLVVAAAVATAGAVFATGSPAAPTLEPLGTDASDQYAAIDGVAATRTTVVERGNDVHRTVARVEFRPGTDHRRVEVLESTDRRYEVSVATGSTLTLYDRDENAVTRFALSGANTEPTRGERVERLFEQLNVTAATDSASTTVPAGVSPLPVVPPSSARRPSESIQAGPLELTFDGTATVNGREAHVLRLSAPGDSASALAQTIWVDAAHYFPLKQRTTWTDDGERVSVTTTYSNVTFDPGLTAGTFDFDAPANATVERLDTPETTTYATADRLGAATSLSVPEPSVPASFRLTVASETTGEIHGVGLRYANETARVTIAKYNRTFPARGDRTVTVAGHEAELSVGPTSSVSWNCDDFRFTVRGQGVPVDVLVAVARSVACE